MLNRSDLETKLRQLFEHKVQLLTELNVTDGSIRTLEELLALDAEPVLDVNDLPCEEVSVGNDPA